ncbi:MAG: tRNA (adenosine(37)-N6)-threonylcarbamoyltransferase complex dimerization subunit type 1 TsaB [Cyanobacteria bacterium P01_G01_bin.54]
MPPITGLALHTSSPELGLALQTPEAGLKQQIWNLGRELSHQLHPYLAEFMAGTPWSQLQFLAVAIGPGGFTGTRLGVITARTLGQQLNLPVFGISTLAAVAWQEREGQIAQTLAVQYPARRGEYFGGVYRVTPEGIEAARGDRLYTPEVWSAFLAEQPHDRFIEAENPLGGTVSAVLELGAIAYAQGQRPHWAEVLPFYGQSPVAST